MKRTMRRLLAAAACVSVVSSAALAADVELKASHQWNTKDVRHKMVQIIADEVAKAGVGVSVKVYPAKSLFKPKEQWAPLTKGRLDISAFPLAYAASRHPEFDATLMPGLVKNHDHAKRLNDSDFMADIKKIINDAGVVVLSDAWLAGGFASKKKCIKAPDDIKGQVSRAAGKAFERMLTGAGASIASMPSSEIYTAMQTGVLDAANTSSGSFVSYRIYEQVKCYTPAGDFALWFMYQPLLMNKSAYDRLDDKQKAALDAAAAKAEAYYLEEAKKQDAASIEVFEKAGVEIKNMTPEEFNQWRDIAKASSYKNFVENVPGGQELLDMALSVE